MECSKCGVSGGEARLFEAISLKEKGIVRLCEKCLREEGIPAINRPTSNQLKESEREPMSYRGLLAKSMRKEAPRRDIEKVESSLKEIVDKNYEARVSSEKKPRPDLVDNFHWILMRARRMKKLTQKQLAKELSESEAAIRMAEQGILPEDDNKLINKLESFLGIRIVKDKFRIPSDRQPARTLKFDPEVAKNLTISDLQRIKAMKEGGILGGSGPEDFEDLEGPGIEIEYEDEFNEGGVNDKRDW